MAIGKDDIFKCYVHNFGARTPDEWNVHKATEDHTYTGSTLCKDCGASNIEINFTGKLANGQTPPAYCSDCKERLKKSLGV